MVSHRFRLNPINTIHLDLVVKTAYEISIVFFIYLLLQNILIIYVNYPLVSINCKKVIFLCIFINSPLCTPDRMEPIFQTCAPN